MPALFEQIFLPSLGYTPVVHEEQGIPALFEQIFFPSHEEGGLRQDALVPAANF